MLFVMPGRGPSHLSIVGQCPGARQMIREGCAFLGRDSLVLEIDLELKSCGF